MSIQKFVVNGDEAKIDYEGLENKPFGEESTTVILQETDDTGFEYVSSGNYYESNHTLTSPLVLTVGDIYHVTFDNVEYLCAAWEIEERDPKVIGVGASNPSDFSSYPFAIAISDGSLMAITNISGSEHIYKIEQISVSTLNPEYLPKYLQYYGNKTLMANDTVTLVSDSDAFSGFISINVPDILVAGDSVLVTWDGTEYMCSAVMDNGPKIRYGDPSSFWFMIELSDAPTNIWTNDSAGPHTIKIEYIPSHIQIKSAPLVYAVDSASGRLDHYLSLVEALNYIAQGANLNVVFYNSYEEYENHH